MLNIQLTESDLELIVTALRNWDGWDYETKTTDSEKVDGCDDLAKHILLQAADQ